MIADFAEGTLVNWQPALIVAPGCDVGNRALSRAALAEKERIMIGMLARCSLAHLRRAAINASLQPPHSAAVPRRIALFRAHLRR